MPDKKISELVAVTSIETNDEFVIGRGTTNNKISGSLLLTQQTAISGIAGSNTTYTSGTVLFSGVGGGVTVGSNTGQRIDISVAAPVAQTAQTGISGIANSQTTYTSGTVNLSVNGGALTIRSTTGNAFQFSVSQSVQAETQTFLGAIANSETTYTSGSVTLSALANITIRSTTGQQFQFSVPGTTGTGNLNAISNSNTTYTSGTIGLSELGAITIRSTTGNQFQFSVNAQTGTYQSAIAASNTTYTSGLVVFTGSNMITVKSSGAGQTVILDATQTNQSAIKGFGASNTGNTAGNTGVSTGVDWVIAGTNNITVSESTAVGGPNTIWLSAPNAGGAGQFSAGVSTGGNTAGATGITGTRLILVGSNMVSLSQTTDANGGTVTFNATQTNQSAIKGLGVSTLGNTAGNTRLTTGQDFVFAGTGALTASQSSGAATDTIWLSVPQTSSLSGTGGIVISTNGSTISVGYKHNFADWENMPRAAASLISHVSAFSKTPIYWNDHLDGDLTAKSLAFAISMVTASQPLSVSVHLGVYTLANSTSANLLGSLSEAYVVSSASSVSLSGVRNVMVTGIGTHATLSTLSGGEYMIGMMFSATATNAMNFSLLGASGGAGPLGGLYPGTNQLSSGTSQGVQALAGRGSTTVNAMPANVQASEVINQGQGASMQLHPWIYIRS